MAVVRKQALVTVTFSQRPWENSFKFRMTVGIGWFFFLLIKVDGRDGSGDNSTSI